MALERSSSSPPAHAELGFVPAFTVLPTGATYRLDAEFFNVEDLDGVGESVLGSGNLNHLILQGELINSFGDPTASMADILSDDVSSQAYQAVRSGAFRPIGAAEATFDGRLLDPGQDDGQTGEESPGDQRGSGQPAGVATLVGGTNATLSGTDSFSAGFGGGSAGGVSIGDGSQTADDPTNDGSGDDGPPPGPGDGGSTDGGPPDQDLGVALDVGLGEGQISVELDLTLDPIEAVLGDVDVTVGVGTDLPAAIAAVATDLVETVVDLAEDGVDAVLGRVTDGLLGGEPSDGNGVHAGLDLSLAGYGSMSVSAGLSLAPGQGLADDLDHVLEDAMMLVADGAGAAGSLAETAQDTADAVRAPLDGVAEPVAALVAPVVETAGTAADGALAHASSLVDDVTDALLAGDEPAADQDLSVSLEIGLGDDDRVAADAAATLDPVEAVIGDIDVVVAGSAETPADAAATAAEIAEELTTTIADATADVVERVTSGIECDLAAMEEVAGSDPGYFAADTGSAGGDLALPSSEEVIGDLVSDTSILGTDVLDGDPGADGLPEPDGVAAEGLGMLLVPQADQSLGSGLFG